jgi:hypothetical protein
VYGLKNRGEEGKIMARPIEPTPTLSGESLKMFGRSMKNAKFNAPKERFLKESDSIYKELSKNKRAFPTNRHA